MDSKDFNPSNILKVNINDVSPNDYNPKKKDTKEYKDVVSSLRVNGLKQPIFVREVNGQYIIVDGEQRYTAAKELGYSEIYIYNLGEISDEEAKALTIWFEVQVPFDEISLAPIVVELNSLEMELPFDEEQIKDFQNMATFSFDDFGDKEPIKDDRQEGFKTLTIKMTESQFKVIRDAITMVSENENVSEGRALELLVADGLAGYQQNNYIPENSPEV